MTNVHTIARANLPPLSYIKIVGNTKPSILYVGGFMSIKTGGKQDRLAARFAKQLGHSFVCFDYTDKGDSVWPDKSKERMWSFEQWKQDALTIFDTVTEGPQLLIGSSMGAWMSLLLALARPERVAGIVTISAAVGFTDRFEQIIPANLRDAYDSGALIEVPSTVGAYTIRRRLVEEARAYNMLASTAPISIQCPVTLLHCINDTIAPYQGSIDLMKQLKSTDVQLHMHKTGSHRMNDEYEIDILLNHVDKMIAKINQTVSHL